jgi:predicted DCC family thiol-disulfide oxidoreductase YuxK
LNGEGSAAPILVYDGDCAFCSRAVRFVLRHDRRWRTVRFAAREGAAGRAVRERHAALRDVESLVWVDWVAGAERAQIRSDAVLAVATYLGGVWALLGGLGLVVPRPLRDGVYSVVARVRRRIAGGAPECLVVTEAERGRVLD